MIIIKSKHKNIIFNSSISIEVFNFLINNIKINNFKTLNEEIEYEINELIINYSEIFWADIKLKFSKMFNKYTSRQIKYWLVRGWGYNEAKELISNNAKRASEKGIRARKIQCEKLKIENPVKLKEQFNTCIEFYISRGMNLEEATQALKERQSTFSKKKMIEKHGEIEGLKKVQERNNKWISSLKENNDWDELSKKKASTLEKMIIKHGVEEGTKWWNNVNITKGKVNKREFFIEKFGDLLGVEKWNERLNKLLVKSGRASKESLKIFIPIFNEFKTIYNCKFGYEDLNEWFIWDDVTKKHFRFDFTLKEPKIIIEYHGEAFHPNKNKLSYAEWKLWRQPFSKLTADEQFKIDQHKKKVAEEKGFKLLEIWSSTPININILLVKEFINKHV